jgi:hypothetical protein
MGATSVTGVGQGAAWGNKGPHNGRDQYVPLLSPHVVIAGTVTVAGGTTAVVFPAALPGAPTNYAVVATAASGSTAITITKAGSTTFTGFTITGANVAHDYIVVTAGLGV